MANNVITISDIARELNMSKTTVSRAISGKGRISKDTTDKVLAYIRENNLTPNTNVPGGAPGSTHNICFAIPADFNSKDMPFFHQCLTGINSIANVDGYDTFVSMIDEDDLGQLKRLVEGKKVDGVILGRSFKRNRSAKYLAENNVPFVLIGSDSDESIVQVDNNHFMACQELIAILLNRGIEKIGLIGASTEFVVNQDRYDGYLSAYKKAGIAVDESLVYLDSENEILIPKIVDDLMAKKVDCIACMDDYICSLVMNAIIKRGYSVPADVKIASFYSSSLIENFGIGITSPHFDENKLGMIACDTLISLIEGNYSGHHTKMEYDLVIKESTKGSI